MLIPSASPLIAWYVDAGHCIRRLPNVWVKGPVAELSTGPLTNWPKQQILTPRASIRGGGRGGVAPTLTKKKTKFFSYKVNSYGIGCKVIYEKGFLIHEEMRKYLTTSGFWPRVRARALRAPVFLGSLSCQKGGAARPPPLAASLHSPDPIELRCTS